MGATKKMRKKLYFAHSRKDYGTKREKDMLRKIKHVFTGCEFINPGEPKFQDEMEAKVDRFQSANEYIQPFLKIINDCTFLVFMPLATGKTGVGTYLEVRHAEACGILVYVWDGKGFTTNYRLDECHTHAGKLDYKDNWSKCTIGKTYGDGEVKFNELKEEEHIAFRKYKKMKADEKEN